MSGAVVQWLRFRRSDAGAAGLVQLATAIGLSRAKTHTIPHGSLGTIYQRTSVLNILIFMSINMHL